MQFADFNFAEPQWLYALLLIPAGWLWHWYFSKFSNNTAKGLEKFADPQLLPHIIIGQPKSTTKRWLGFVYSLLMALLITALANPRWNYKDVDAFTPTASMVVLLDLGLTMNARDIAPSRVIRARQNLEDLLKQSKGLKVGLIGFAAIPHLISPITDDLKTVQAFLPALDTDLISKQGDALGPALNAAADLLQREPGDKKTILLISDGNFAESDYSNQLRAIVGQNVMVDVMAIGTTSGAPYSDQAGNLMKKNGQLLISKLDDIKLKQIAKQGRGVYVEANYSSAGIEKILAKAQYNNSGLQPATGKIRQWEDRFYFLLAPAMMLFMYLLARRQLYAVLLVLSFSLFSTNTIEAFELSSLFKNTNQQAKAEFDQTNFQQAAVLFSDHYNKGVAMYRAGDYAAAEKEFIQANALYNAGNAQMQQKKWRKAITNYEQVLKQQPNNADAQFNLELAKKMLAQNQDNKQQEKNEDQDQEQESDDDQSDDNKNDQQNQQDSEKEEQDQQEQENQDDDQEDDDQNDNQDDEQDNQQDANAAEQNNIPQNPQQAAQEQRAEQWLNRINSDIKVFLHNKFYIEDMVSSK